MSWQQLSSNMLTLITLFCMAGNFLFIAHSEQTIFPYVAVYSVEIEDFSVAYFDCISLHSKCCTVKLP